MRVRYHKYKGRYSDLARHYKELERDREKVKVRVLNFISPYDRLFSNKTAMFSTY